MIIEIFYTYTEPVQGFNFSDSCYIIPSGSRDEEINNPLFENKNLPYGKRFVVNELPLNNNNIAHAKVFARRDVEEKRYGFNNNIVSIKAEPTLTVVSASIV